MLFNVPLPWSDADPVRPFSTPGVVRSPTRHVYYINVYIYIVNIYIYIYIVIILYIYIYIYIYIY